MSALFARAWVRRPLEVGAIAPSSAALAAAMAALVPPGARTVAELGPGTGVVTRALLAAGVPAQGLHLVEIAPAFAAALRARFPDLAVHAGPAQALVRQLPHPLDAVVSGLPLLSMARADRAAILAGAFARMAPGAPFIQFTYGPASPVEAAILAALGLAWTRTGRIWGNAPPATVYVYRRGRGAGATG